MTFLTSLGGYPCGYTFSLVGFGKKFLSVNSADPELKGKLTTKEKCTTNAEVNPKDKFVCIYLGRGVSKSASKIINIFYSVFKQFKFFGYFPVTVEIQYYISFGYTA